MFDKETIRRNIAKRKRLNEKALDLARRDPAVVGEIGQIFSNVLEKLLENPKENPLTYLIDAFAIRPDLLDAFFSLVGLGINTAVIAATEEVLQREENDESRESGQEGLFYGLKETIMRTLGCGTKPECENCLILQSTEDFVKNVGENPFANPPACLFPSREPGQTVERPDPVKEVKVPLPTESETNLDATLEQFGEDNARP